MSEIKVGDVVDVAFKAKVINHTEHTVRVRHISGGLDSIAIWRSEATKPKPELPVAFGSVVRVDDEAWVLRSDTYWESENYSNASRGAMLQMNFEVIRDGV